MTHGHIINLINRGINNIFYPCVVYEKKEFREADNNYNCPMVISYPEAIRNNIDELKDKNINFMQPFLSLDNPRELIKRIHEEFKMFNVSLEEAKNAVECAVAEQENYKNDIRKKVKK